MKQRKKLIKTILLALIIITLICVSYIIFTKKSDPVDIKSPQIVKSDEFSLEIPKLNISAPVITGIDPMDKNIYDEALTGGVAHMNGTWLPGEGNNIFIYGHSSAETVSKYQKIFAKISELQKDDSLFLNYKGKVYNYIVKEIKIVEKDDFSVLEKTDNEQLRLMTCWPIGTSRQRLIVISDLKN